MWSTIQNGIKVSGMNTFNLVLNKKKYFKIYQSSRTFFFFFFREDILFQSDWYQSNTMNINLQGYCFPNKKSMYHFDE
jgi:hypothetical protein